MKQTREKAGQPSVHRFGLGSATCNHKCKYREGAKAQSATRFRPHWAIPRLERCCHLRMSKNTISAKSTITTRSRERIFPRSSTLEGDSPASLSQGRPSERT